MPTIYHRASREMVGTLSLCPPYELQAASHHAQAQFQCATTTNQPDGQITKSLSILSRKNIPLAPSGKSVI